MGVGKMSHFSKCQSKNIKKFTSLTTKIARITGFFLKAIDSIKIDNFGISLSKEVDYMCFIE